MLKGKLRAQYKGQEVEINLAECGYANYSVDCVYKYIKAKDKYSLTIWLKCNGIDCRFNMNPQEVDSRYITSTKEDVVGDICGVVEQLCETKFFDHYIERYEYEMQCFERGHDLFEKERKAAACNV